MGSLYFTKNTLISCFKISGLENTWINPSLKIKRLPISHTSSLVFKSTSAFAGNSLISVQHRFANRCENSCSKRNHKALVAERCFQNVQFKLPPSIWRVHKNGLVSKRPTTCPLIQQSSMFMNPFYWFRFFTLLHGGKGPSGCHYDRKRKKIIVS